MDKKDIIRGVLLAMVLVAAWVGLKLYWQHAHPEWFLPAGAICPDGRERRHAAEHRPHDPARGGDAAVEHATIGGGDAATAPTTGPSVASSGPSVQAGFTIVRPTSAEAPARCGSARTRRTTRPGRCSSRSTRWARR